MDSLSPEALAAAKRAAADPTRATLADEPRVTETLARAFADDPVIDYFVRADERRAAALRTWFSFAVKKIGLPDDEIWMTPDAGAVALWLPPPQRTMKFTALEELKLVRTLLSVVSMERVGRMQRLRAAFDSHHPKAPHWYLMFLAVDPDLQGLGLGSALLKAMLEQIDARGQAAYLEASSERNVPLYKRHGFEVKGEFRPEPDGPPIWSMWRDPQKRWD
jgi:ribosomal protein S18 acetylase RimI-like enzyme